MKSMKPEGWLMGAADIMEDLGVSVTVFHDDVSDDQDENLKRIVDFHNNQGAHDLDVSVHFNSATFNGSNQTSNPVGCEVFLYFGQWRRLGHRLRQRNVQGQWID